LVPNITRRRLLLHVDRIHFHTNLSVILQEESLALKARIDMKLVRSFGVAWILSFIIPAIVAALFAVAGSTLGIFSIK